LTINTGTALSCIGVTTRTCTGVKTFITTVVYKDVVWRDIAGVGNYLTIVWTIFAPIPCLAGDLIAIIGCIVENSTWHSVAEIF